MYLSILKIENFRQFGQANHGLEVAFNPGVTALVGENDAGKTAVIDPKRTLRRKRQTDSAVLCRRHDNLCYYYYLYLIYFKFIGIGRELKAV